MFNLSQKARNAIWIGTMCSLSYLAVYFARNILGAVSPQMTDAGVFTTVQIGSLSSTYFITYAVGQLINGAIGDKIKAKYMICVGLAMAGVCNLIFSMIASTFFLSQVAYGLTGFFLAMIYGPMTKLVAENTDPIYATRCSLGYTFASFFGSPVAGLFAAWLAWENVFRISSITLVGMAVICFTAFCAFERRGIIKYNQYQKPEGRGGSIKILLKHRIVKFTLISILTGVVRTTVVFWLPTYLNEYLEFSAKDASLLFTVATLVISATTFITVFIYERLGRNMDLTILLGFIASTVSFLMVFLFKQQTVNVIFMILGIMSSNAAACMLWSRYCPSLRDTGVVSGATGFLDFVSYMAASASSALFANAASTIGWHGLILVWFGLMACGVIVSLPYEKFKKKTAE
ncbi:MAG: MFS transporter [Clostridia bacterium]|nr:MFS transporter [Clostridia bacterium]